MKKDFWRVDFSMQDAIQDFILSRQAKMCTPRTIKWYSYSLDKIKEWFIEKGVKHPKQINNKVIRAILRDLVESGYSNSYVHMYARVLRTFTKFLYKEEYISEEINFDMPKLKQMRQRVYSKKEIKQILAACKTKRNKAFIMFMVDSGVRLAEVLALNWEDVNIKNGIVRINNGKGGKFRTVVVSVETRRALIKYRAEIDADESKAVFQTIHGTRFTESGLRSWMNRLSQKAGVHITPHALRRSFATLSVKAGMDLFRLQALMGHSSLEMTKQYVRTLDEDLLEAHQKHSPINLVLNQ
jgi:integrase/recombinase XerD